MKNFSFYILTTLLLFSSGCDSGDIYPEENNKNDKKITANIWITGIKALPKENKLVIAAYADGEEFPSITQAIEPTENNQLLSVTLNYVPEDANRTTITILGKTWKEIYNFYEGDIAYGKETTIPEQSIDLASFQRVQYQLFNQCIQCHGGSTSAAGNLFLTTGKSYSAITDIKSAYSDKKIVAPGNIEESFIVDVLEGNASLRYNHTSISALKKEDITLLKAWIEDGGEND